MLLKIIFLCNATFRFLSIFIVISNISLQRSKEETIPDSGAVHGFSKGLTAGSTIEWNSLPFSNQSSSSGDCQQLWKQVRHGTQRYFSLRTHVSFCFWFRQFFSVSVNVNSSFWFSYEYSFQWIGNVPFCICQGKMLNLLVDGMKKFLFFCSLVLHWGKVWSECNG